MRTYVAILVEKNWGKGCVEASRLPEAWRYNDNIFVIKLSDDSCRSGSEE